MQTSITKKTKFTRTSTLLQNNTTTQHAIDQFTSKNVSGQQKISNYLQANVYDKSKHLLMETLNMAEIISRIPLRLLSVQRTLHYCSQKLNAYDSAPL